MFQNGSIEYADIIVLKGLDPTSLIGLVGQEVPNGSGTVKDLMVFIFHSLGGLHV